MLCRPVGQGCGRQPRERENQPRKGVSIGCERAFCVTWEGFECSVLQGERVRDLLHEAGVSFVLLRRKVRKGWGFFPVNTCVSYLGVLAG